MPTPRTGPKTLAELMDRLEPYLASAEAKPPRWPAQSDNATSLETCENG